MEADQKNKSNMNFKDTAYSIIKKKIITCELMPGSVIDQNFFVEELGISRTPVREAIHALEQEGFIVIAPRRGVFVSNILYSEIRNIYDVRELVEPAIVRLCAPYLEISVLEYYQQIFKQQPDAIEDIFEQDFGLHKYLAEKTGNPYLIRLMENVLSHNMRIVVLTAKIPDRLNESNKEHLDVIEKLIAQDVEGAVAAMTKHIAHAKQVASMLK